MHNRFIYTVTIIISIMLGAVPAAYAMGPGAQAQGGRAVEVRTVDDDDDSATSSASIGTQVQIQARTNAELREMIQVMDREAEHNNASSTATGTPVRKANEQANRVSTAVHALLATRTMLGGIGQQVSQIAQGIEDSVATTTAAEEQIRTRGFWSRLFLGGDSQAADKIQQLVEQNQSRVSEIAKLIGGSQVSADLKATLQEQLAVMEQEQTRLQELAKQQKKLWGIFSWRF